MSDSTVLREAREAKKLAIKRDVYAKRVDMIQNASSNRVAVDPASCEAIINEKRAAAALAKESDRQQAMENRRINLVLAKAEIDDVERRQAEIEDTKSSWLAQTDRRNRIEADLDPKLNKPQPINPDACGLSACYNFAGEDRLKPERTRLQQRQITKWTATQIEEKKAREADFKNQDHAYAQYLKDIDGVRERIEREAIDEVAQARKQQQQHNIAQAQEQAQLKAERNAAELKANQDEMDNMYNDPFLNEVQTRNPDGRVRRDNYKGLSKDELKGLFADNQALVKDHTMNKRDDRADDKQWVKQQQMINRVIAEAEIGEQERRQQALLDQKAEHFQQMADARAREKANKEASRGAFDAGFFGKFGTSHR